MDSAHVDQAVIVQPSVYGWDNSFVLDAVDQFPDRFVVVALLDPDSTEWRRRLDSLLARSIRGVRFNLVARPSARWLTEGRYSDLWAAIADRGIPVCFQAAMSQLPAVGDLAALVPSLTIVVDHLGKPTLNQGSAAWRPLLDLGRFSNICVKVSGFHEQGADWDGFRPLIIACLSTFGVSRLMWGSDAPGVLRVSDYPGTMKPVSGLSLKPDETESIFDGTARRIFRLPLS
jgi:L-fuconolactonase